MFRTIWKDWTSPNKIIATACVVGAALGPAFYAFGPVLLEKLLPGDSGTEVAIQQNSIVLKQLAEALERSRENPGELQPQPEKVSSPITAAPAPTAPAGANVSKEPEGEALARRDTGLPPADIAKPSAVEAKPPIVVTPPSAVPQVPASTAPSVFGVFEQEKFDLCGFHGFTARLVTGKAGQEVLIESEDRSIPDRSFRGYELSMPLEQPIRLWDKCVVGVGYSSNAGIRQIVFSVALEG